MIAAVDAVLGCFDYFTVTNSLNYKIKQQKKKPTNFS